MQLTIVDDRPFSGAKGQLRACTFDVAPIMATALCGCVALICSRRGADPAQVWRQLARRGEHSNEFAADPAWKEATEIRAIALYLVNTLAAVPQRWLARAFDLTPAAVCIALHRIEDRREDAAFDAELATLAWLVSGVRS